MERRVESQSNRQRGSARWWLAAPIFLALVLVGCDDTDACFPITTSCTDASGFSDFFATNVPCCEGVCTTLPPITIGGSPVVRRVCQ